MIVYASSKNRFIHDVVNDDIQTIIQNAFENKLKRRTSPAEIESWRDSLMYMQVLLMDDKIPQDAGVLVEFMIPQSSFRVDFIITGRDEQDKMKVIIIELKRWTQAQATEKDGIVKTRFRGGLAETSHPSYQAWSYAAFMYSYNETIYTEDISLHPCAYLHNYQDDNTLTSSFYQTYLDRAPLFFKSDK